MNVGVKDSDVLTSVGQHEVVGHEFAVVDEVILDYIGAIAEAKNEVLVAEVGIVLHHVPQDRPVAYMHHGLGDAFAGFPDPHAEASAEQYYFHFRVLLSDRPTL